MRHDEFRIGEHFHLARADSAEPSRWRVTDIGTRTIAAIRVDQVTIAAYPRQGRARVLSGAEAEAQGWFSGPPYGVAEHVFDEDDLEACVLTIEEV